MTSNSSSLPRAKLFINGVELIYLDIKISSVNAAISDTLTTSIPLYAYSFDYLDKFFNSTDENIVEVQIDEIGNQQFKRVFYGILDDYRESLDGGRVFLSGRDFSAKLIDNKTTIKFVELSSSQVAETLAKANGLKSVVTETTNPIGIYYDNQHVDLLIQRSQWDILSALAQQEGFDLYVKDDTLYFVDKEKVSHPSYDINVIAPAVKYQVAQVPNVITLDIARSFTLAKKIIVTVKSYNQLDDKTYIGVATREHITGKSSQAVQRYTIYPPNLTKEQATRLANATLQQITKREVVLDARVVGSTLLQKDTIVNLKGRSKTFDGKYYIDSLTHEMVFNTGFTTSFTAKNHSTLSTKVLL